MEDSITRRRFLQLSAAAGGAAVLAACGGTPAANTAPTAAAAAAPTAAAAAAPTAASAAAPAGTAVKLSLLNENWGEVYNNLMINISDDFTKKNPDIGVEWNFDPDFQAKLTTLIAAGTPPDANTIRPGLLATLAKKGALTELDSQVQTAGLKREDFIASIYDSCLYNNKLYAIPGGADYICMFYSKDVYRDAGLDPEKPPTTLDELLAHSQQILQKDSAGEIQRVGYVPSAGHMINWSYIFGGGYYDAAGGKITANNPANVAVLDRMASYVKTLDINKLASFNSRPGTYEAGNPFATKQSAYIFDGFWTYEALDQHAPDIDYGVAFWPTAKGTPEERKNYAISGWMYAIPSASKNSDAAWKFIRYAFIDECAKMGYLTLNGPCVKSQLKPWEDGLRAKIGSTNRIDKYLKTFADTGAAATNFFPILPVQSYYNDELSRIYDLVVRGEMTAQAGLDEVTKNVQAELDKAA